MKVLALKVDVDTLRGTREGVPQLVELLKKHNAQSTFLFSLGPDHTGWAIKRVFRPGFFGKVKRTSVVSHYGLKTLMYGTLLPAPNIGKKAQDIMRRVRDAGIEVGIHTYDHVYWQDNVYGKPKPWTDRELSRASEAFRDIFAADAKTHGAAGWQMNTFAFDWIEKFQYASDTRGETPFFPQIQGKTRRCLQLPTTLPTMDEVLGVDGVTETNIADHFLKLTAQEREHGHVFTLHAELEGMKLIRAFEEFLVGAKKQGYEFVSLEQLFARVKTKPLAVCELEYGSIEGRSGQLYKQGAAVK